MVSEAAAEDNWKGRTGFVHHALMEDHNSLVDYNVYACSPLMVNAAFDDLTKKLNLGEKTFFRCLHCCGRCKKVNYFRSIRKQFYLLLSLDTNLLPE